MKRLGLGALLLAIGGIAGYAVRDLETLFLDMNPAGVMEWQDARMGFVEAMAATACATTADLRAAATARGWEVVPDTARGIAPFDNAAEVLWVDVSPSLPFAKWDGDPFGFDAQGCLLP